VTLGGFGRFPAAGAPRILWLGLKEGGDKLGALALHLAGGLAQESFIPERGFTPHVTIARVKSALTPPGPSPNCGVDEEALRSVAGRAAGLEERDTVTHLRLVKSELSADGPRYSIMYSSELL
jgi:2'-5' RNA ligase